MSSDDDPHDEAQEWLRKRIDFLETSEYGRDKRYPSGWWIIPVAVASLCVIAVAVIMLSSTP